MKTKPNGRQRAAITRPTLIGSRARNGHKKTNGRMNHYLCSLEKNQAGKFALRIRARFARQNWLLSVYSVSATFDQAMRKLEQTLRFMQRSEERLWFWGIDRSDDPNFAADLLGTEGLKVDRRSEFPAHSVAVMLAPDRPVHGELLQPVRRDFSQTREMARSASA